MSTPDPIGSRRRRRLIAAAVVLVALATWVFLAGRILVRTDDPGRPQVVFSLSGDPLGDRLRAAAVVVHETGANRLVVMSTGPGEVYDWRDDALAYLEDAGIPREIVRFVGPVLSTTDEARMAAGYASRCGWTNVVVATSPYHTRRAGWLFERAMEDDATVAVVASDEPFDAASWWSSDASRELVLLEWVKGLSAAKYIVIRPEPIDPGTPC